MKLCMREKDREENRRNFKYIFIALELVFSSHCSGRREQDQLLLKIF